MEPNILFRKEFNSDTATEFDVASKYFPCSESRVGLVNKLVIGRYSVLPFYTELEKDLKAQGSVLINSSQQHRFIANFDWYDLLKDYTPRTWFDLQSVPKDGGPFVLKGRTNSRKFEWKQKCFAKDYLTAVSIETELMQDGLIGPQGVIIREFVPLNVLEVGLNDLPFANEWRFFFYKNKMLTNGFYWTASEKRGTLTMEAKKLAQEVADKLQGYVNFFVVDIAEKANGEWVLIEVNDGQMSGLSGCEATHLYSSLKNQVC